MNQFKASQALKTLWWIQIQIYENEWMTEAFKKVWKVLNNKMR